MAFGFEFSVVDNELQLGTLVASVLADNPDAAAKAAQRSAAKFADIVKRSLGRTGSFLFQEAKAAFGPSNPLGLAPAQVIDGMREKNYANESAAKMAANPFAKDAKTFSEAVRKNKFVYNKGKQHQRQAGAGFRALMQYRFQGDNQDNVSLDYKKYSLYVGLIPERRGGPKWEAAFDNWQRPGPIGYQGESTRRFLAAIGIYVKRGFAPVRPERNVLGQVEERNKPEDVFAKALIERINKATDNTVTAFFGYDKPKKRRR